MTATNATFGDLPRPTSWRYLAARSGLDKTFSGTLVVRMPATLHRSAYIEAAKAGISLNAWNTESLEAKVLGEQAARSA